MKNDQGAAQSTPELLPTQADRDFAARIYQDKRDHDYAGVVRTGRADGDHWVQLAARHRIEHSTPDRNAVLGEAAKRVREQLYPTNPESDWTPYAKDMAHAAVCAENAIRALMTTTPEPTDHAGVSELLARIDYILDPSASATERAGRRAHLTNHDLRTCRAALSRTPDPLLEVAKEALEKARALIDCIEQCPRDARWWVNAFDPENAVCETSEAVSAALKAIGAGQ